MFNLQSQPKFEETSEQGLQGLYVLCQQEHLELSQVTFWKRTGPGSYPEGLSICLSICISSMKIGLCFFMKVLFMGVGVFDSPYPKQCKEMENKIQIEECHP